MSAALLVQCPSCEQQFAVRIEALDPALRGPEPRAESRAANRESRPAPPSRPAQAAAAPREIEVEFRDDVGYEVNCPTHGWTAAKEWPQSAKGPACIQCQGKTNGQWCTVRVPLAEARRLAGVR